LPESLARGAYAPTAHACGGQPESGLRDPRYAPLSLAAEEVLVVISLVALSVQAPDLVALAA